MNASGSTYKGGLSILSILLIGTLVLIGCQGPSAQTSELAPVKFRLDWQAGAQHAPFYLAKEKGYYAEEGIDLEIIIGSGSSDAIKQLGSDAVEVALIDALVLAQGLEQEVPVTAVAAYYQRSPITIMSPAANPVDQPQDLLNGVKLGSKKGSATFQGLVAFLEANSIQQEQITLVDIGFGVQPLLVGQVDAMMGFTMNEPIEAESNGMDIHEMLIADHGVNAYGLTIAASHTFAEAHPDLLEGFLRATRRGMEEAATQEQAAVDAVSKAVAEINKEREEIVLQKTIPFWSSDATESNGYGWQTDEQWQSTIDTAVRLGLIQNAVPVSEIYTNDYLK